MRRIHIGWIGLGVLFFSLAGSAWADWQESTLSTNPEGASVSGVNDSQGTASSDPALTSFPNQGTGVLANGNDQDWYRLNGISGSQQFLKVSLTCAEGANIELLN